MSLEPTVIYSAASVQQAYLLRSALEEQGIKALVVNDSIQMAGGELPVGWTAAPRVVVPGDQAEAALRVVAEFEHPGPESRRMLDSYPDVDPLEWPRCPSCQQKRCARCPVCRAVETEFPLAHYQPGSEPNLFLCATCDDAMQPEWYRYCASCGFDFGEGITAPVHQVGEFQWDSLLVWLVGAGLLLVGIAIAYVAWLFR